MSQVPYRLHAVLVHEGQANAGHYWAYIYDPHQRCWMKYNDISVTKSSWEELVRDSFGGYRNASAYCLMYINDRKPFLIEGKYKPISGLWQDSCIFGLLEQLQKLCKFEYRNDNLLRGHSSFNMHCKCDSPSHFFLVLFKCFCYSSIIFFFPTKTTSPTGLNFIFALQGCLLLQTLHDVHF